MVLDAFDCNLGYWCRDAAQKVPARDALIDLSRDPARHVSYRELDERANRVASLLRHTGFRAGDRVAVAISNRFEFVEILYGAMRAGVVPVPLNTQQGADVLDYILRDAGVSGAFIEPACNRFIREVVDGLDLARAWGVEAGPQDGIDQRPLVPYEEELSAVSPDFAPGSLPPFHPAFQPYTTGSTGRPKGVVLTHEGQLWWLRCLRTYWPEKNDARALAAVPLYHKNAMAGAIKPLLQSGGTVVLLPNFEPVRFLRTLAEYRCTQAGGVPAVFAKLLQHRELIESLDLSHLESLSIGSAPVQEELLSAVESAFGVRVTESYGLTEGGPVMIGPPIDGTEVPRGSCGVAWPEGEVKLVDVDGNESESYGELWVRNPGVTPGYHNLPEVNAKRLRDGWLATGDLFHKDRAGFFYFRGRLDDMFNCGGENVYPKEVENLLLSHDSVYDAAVVPIPHAMKGHVPVAMVMRHPDCESVSEDSLKAFCLDRGPAYAHPRRVLVVEQLPLNGAGKVDRSAVARTLAHEFGPELGRRKADGRGTSG